MKKSILLLCLVLFLFSCNTSKKELFQTTDRFVDSLQTTYESYGLQGTKHAKVTPDSLYQIAPIGRLVNVKILKVVEDEIYENLKEDLQNHYKDDKRVNDVYISEGGTVMIDCRN